MTPKELIEYLEFAIPNRFTVLVKGKPGIGKSDIITRVASALNADLIIDHPVVADPTDFKGLPFARGEQAHFLPFKNLWKVIIAEKPTVFFLDDLGQAPVSVQAAVMQLLLARQIGEHKVSDYVTFIAATNRKEDKAGVTGLLEPVKSRFKGGIIELEVNHEDWVEWAIPAGMPPELIAFIRFRPELLDNAKPSKDLVNTASPRTVAAVGEVERAGVPRKLEFEVFEGIAGEAFAAEYKGFLKTYRQLPSIEDILQKPHTAIVPTGADALIAVSTALAARADQQNMENITIYLNRLPKEYQVAAMKDITLRNTEATRTMSYVQWGSKNTEVLI